MKSVNIQTNFMIAEIISIGAELLLGETLDTNAVFLSEELKTLGINIYFRTTVGDNISRISNAVELALGRSDLVITTGGLGPTDGDITRDGIAHALGEEIKVDRMLLEGIEKMFSSRGRKMSPKNRKQAGLIPSARGLPNPVGTAPGWFVEKDGKKIVALPGPPHEMKIMWTDQVRRLLFQSQKGFYSVTLHTLGIGESNLADLLGDLTEQNNPSVATYARPHGIDIRIAASAESQARARTIVEPVLARVMQFASRFIYGRDSDNLPAAIETLLREKNQTVGIIEGFSSGLICATLCECPGVRQFFKGGFNASIGPNLLQISAVCTNLAESAEKLRKLMSADWVIGCSDLDGEIFPDGRYSGKVSVVVAGKDVCLTEKLDWPGEINHSRRRVANMALFLLLRALKGEK